MAVPAGPDSRVITPATYTAETSPPLASKDMQKADWPKFAMSQDNASFTGYKGAASVDNSFLGNILSGDFFMGPLDTDAGSNWLGSTAGDGFVAVHGHPLNGSKFFTWGQNPSGRFMQDFLGGISGPDPIADEDRIGDYAELQVRAATATTALLLLLRCCYCYAAAPPATGYSRHATYYY